LTIERIFGLDFSGAADAGRRLWLAEGSHDADGFRLDRCLPGSDLPGSAARRDACLTAVVEFIAGQRHAVIGCDFPFGLPAVLMRTKTWRDFALGFDARYADPAALRDDCMRRANGRELKRSGDRTARVPFSAYNIRLYRQTFHGIRDLLAPLVRRDAARILPMQTAWAGRPWLVETCPASTLKQAGLYLSYKGAGKERRAARRRIVAGLVRQGLLRPLRPALRALAVADEGGDALDAIIAAAATARAWRRGDFDSRPADGPTTLEGQIYY